MPVLLGDFQQLLKCFTNVAMARFLLDYFFPSCSFSMFFFFFLILTLFNAFCFPMNHIRILLIQLIFSKDWYQALGTKSWLKVVDNENSPSYGLSCPHGGPPVGTQIMRLRSCGDLVGTALEQRLRTAILISWKFLCALPWQACIAKHASMHYLIFTITLLCYKGRTTVLERNGPTQYLSWEGKSQVLNTLARQWTTSHLSGSCAQFFLGLVCGMGRVLDTGLVPFLLGHCYQEASSSSLFLPDAVNCGN